MTLEVRKGLAEASAALAAIDPLLEVAELALSAAIVEQRRPLVWPSSKFLAAWRASREALYDAAEAMGASSRKLRDAQEALGKSKAMLDDADEARREARNDNERHI